MRAYGIALFIILFNFSLYMLNATGVIPVSVTPVIDAEEYSEIDITKTEDKLSLDQDSDMTGGLIGGSWFLLQGFGQLKDIIINSTISFPKMLANPPFNLPLSIVVALSAIQILVYLAGMIDYVAGRKMGS